MVLKKQTRQILSELFDQNTNNDFDALESRLDHTLTQLINLIDQIDAMDILEDEKAQLQKRIILSIKNKDTDKTLRTVRSVRKKYKGK